MLYFTIGLTLMLMLVTYLIFLRKIKRYYFVYILRKRRVRRKKFSPDDKQQERLIKLIERLIRNSNSRLFYHPNHEKYYIEHGKTYVMFNGRIASIIDSETGGHSVLLYEALFLGLVKKFNLRLKTDANVFEEKFNEQVDSVIDNINQNIDI